MLVIPCLLINGTLARTGTGHRVGRILPTGDACIGLARPKFRLDFLAIPPSQRIREEEASQNKGGDQDHRPNPAPQPQNGPARQNAHDQAITFVFTKSRQNAMAAMPNATPMVIS